MPAELSAGSQRYKRKETVIETIWTYRVKVERREEFERRYRSDGDWAKLFARAKGYRGTTLLRDVNENGRYATIDRWESGEDLASFKQQFGKEYQELDAVCEELTESEEHVGVFERI